MRPEDRVKDTAQRIRLRNPQQRAVHSTCVQTTPRSPLSPSYKAALLPGEIPSTPARSREGLTTCGAGSRDDWTGRTAPHHWL